MVMEYTLPLLSILLPELFLKKEHIMLIRKWMVFMGRVSFGAISILVNVCIFYSA